MKNKKVSIIYTCFNPTRVITQITMATLANIRRYTDPKDYELIVVDSVPKYGIMDDYNVLKLGSDGHYIKEDEDKGYYAAMNRGASLATGDYLCFIENDIFVFENWLKDLVYYLDNDLCDVIVPDQVPRSRKEVLKFRKMSHEDSMFNGIQEQGLLLMKRGVFNSIGGWDERFFKIYGWKAFGLTLANKGLRVNSTTKVNISHIAGMSYFHDYENNYKGLNEEMDKELKIIKEYYD